MVIYDFDLMGVLTFPAKAEAPLVVDANAVLAATGAFEGFQAIARRKAHDVESVGGIELQELSAGGALDVGRKVARGDAAEEFFRFGIGEALDHAPNDDPGGTARKGNYYVRRNYWKAGIFRGPGQRGSKHPQSPAASAHAHHTTERYPRER
jgi:hypothetical protein